MSTQVGGIDADGLWRFIEEQIYSLPGTTRHRDAFTVLLTGSRASAMHTVESDVDIDVLCPQSVYESVHRASLDAGIIQAKHSFFYLVPGDDYGRYFGKNLGRPHFSVIPLEQVEQQFRDYDDVWLWIWTGAKVIADPNGQFQHIVDGFTGYPPEVLVRKIKYRWLLSAHWEIDVYPHHHTRDEEILSASTALVNAVNELLKVFFLVEGKPFPYAEKLMVLARSTTKLGQEFCPMLQRVVNLVVGRTNAELEAWDRLDRAFELLARGDLSPECRRLEEACATAMISAGVDQQWVETDYNNIEELLSGKLGPMP